jgi:Ni/Fe-hydrogenase subunit HybB-like protein
MRQRKVKNKKVRGKTEMETVVPDKKLLTTEGKRFLKFLLQELKPKGKLLTPFNILAAVIIGMGAVLIIIRFVFGLGSVTNLSQDFPWGIWIGFDVITGVAFAGGAYVLVFLVYVLNLEKYHPIARITVLNGFLAYVFYTGALLLDLGRPWNVVNPIIGNSFGVSSVMFLVAWHFLLYMLAELIEFSPAIAEWLGWKKIHKVLHSLTLGTVVIGITLSTLHQAGLGALFLMAKSKIHPLWYSEFIPIQFFISSIFAGLSMVIFEGSISRRVFRKLLSPEAESSHDDIVLSLTKICAGSMFVYTFLKVLMFIHEKHWSYINSAWGYWYLLEMVGFVIVPMIVFIQAYRHRSLPMVKVAAVTTLLGIVLNRLNVSVIAYNWQMVQRYIPSWMEIEVTLAVIFVEIVVLRWIVNRMPVLSESPTWATHQNNRSAGNIYTIKEKESVSWKVSNI